jgi:hypothetical protein
MVTVAIAIAAAFAWPSVLAGVVSAAFAWRQLEHGVVRGHPRGQRLAAIIGVRGTRPAGSVPEPDRAAAHYAPRGH